MSPQDVKWRIHRKFYGREQFENEGHRPENLLLIGALATFSARLVGKLADLKNIHRRHQANTVRDRNVLSTRYLGLEVIGSSQVVMTPDDSMEARRVLSENRGADEIPG